MRRKHFFVVISLLAIFLGSAAAGRRLRTSATHLSAIGAYAQVNVIPDPGSLPAACRAVTRVTSIEKVETGNSSETFLVKWTNSVGCLNEAAVELTVTRQDGQSRILRETVSGATQALIKVGLLFEGNRSKSVSAVVTAAGEQRSVVEKTVNL